MLKKHGIDLFMMSTYGYGGIKRRLLGSVTDGVMLDSETPVLVLPAVRTLLESPRGCQQFDLRNSGSIHL